MALRTRADGLQCDRAGLRAWALRTGEPKPISVVRIDIDGWILECDPEATRRALAAVPQGAAETCACKYCRNFAAARDLAFGTAVRDFLERMGVPLDREAEVYEVGPAEKLGFFRYAGWFHAIGRIVQDPLLDVAPAGPPFTSTNGNLTLFFARGALSPHPGLEGRGLIQIEFEVEVPWVLPEPIPED